MHLASKEYAVDYYKFCLKLGESFSGKTHHNATIDKCLQSPLPFYRNQLKGNFSDLNSLLICLRAIVYIGLLVTIPWTAWDSCHTLVRHCGHLHALCIEVCNQGLYSYLGLPDFQTWIAIVPNFRLHPVK